MVAREIFRVATPKEYTSSPRASTPGRPPGILVKSPRPASFCARVKAQWSVETVWISPLRSPAHRARQSSDLRMGGAHT